MQAKLFMIPWIWLVANVNVAEAQNPPPNSPSTQTLTGDLLVDAHHRQFYEMLRRQQQINDALLLNNVLLHPHIPQLHMPPPPSPDGLIVPPPLNPALFNPFGTPQNLQPPSSPSAASTSKLGQYEKEVIRETAEKEGTVEGPNRAEYLENVRKTLAGVKTVSIQRKGEVNVDQEKTSTVSPPPAIVLASEPVATTKVEIPTTPSTVSPNQAAVTLPTSEGTSAEELKVEDLEMVHLFKKLNLSKEETKSIVEHVEQVVREELARKLKEAERAHTTSLPLTTTVASVPITTPTPAPSTTTPEPITPLTEASTEAITESTTPPPSPTTTTPETTTTTTSTPPVHIYHPQLRVRSEDDLVIHRNNLKHHPIKNAVKKLPEVLRSSSEEISQGSIKTSLKHLPIIVANEEDDKELSQKSSLHKRILIASHDKEKENDRDLLVDFATGAPLDLTDQDLLKKEKEPTATPEASTSAPSLPVAVNNDRSAPLVQTTLPPRLNHHERTNFEKLATDYRSRLENTGDINKILQKISENAYISLVERGGRRKLFRP